jgi:hypothetical protein
MANNNSTPVLTNVLISGNHAYRGGGMYSENSSPSLTNVTISGNRVDNYGGGIANNNSSNPSINNSIIWGNDAVTGPNVNNNASTPTYQNSLVQGSGGSGSGLWGDFGTDVGLDNIDLNPQFVTPLAATAAPTTSGNYRLQNIDNSAINGGLDSLYTSLILTDLAGNPRFNGTIDMGAYEY